MNSSPAHGTITTTEPRVLPAIVGAGLAVLMAAAMTYMPVAAIALLIGVTVVAIIALSWKGAPGLRVVRWWARTAGVIVGALMAMIVLGDVVGGHGPPLATVTGVAITSLWAVLFLGVVAAFFREGAAGVILIIAALALQVPGIGWPNPYIMIFAVVGVALIYCWWRSRRLTT
jgi:hypothetical protein